MLIWLKRRISTFQRFLSDKVYIMKIYLFGVLFGNILFVELGALRSFLSEKTYNTKNHSSKFLFGNMYLIR